MAGTSHSVRYILHYKSTMFIGDPSMDTLLGVFLSRESAERAKQEIMQEAKEENRFLPKENLHINLIIWEDNNGND